MPEPFMKPSRVFRRNKRPQNSQKPQQIRQPAKGSPWRWVLLILLVVAAFGGTWAAVEWVAIEYLIPSKIPQELVGKWVVQGGSQDGATFDFSRRGTLEAMLNNQGAGYVLKAGVAVEGKSLLITTQNPHTKQGETRTANIRELTAYSLIVEFEKNEVFIMVRAR
jgi:hypothetical protein